jgi:hypothetical protein
MKSHKENGVDLKGWDCGYFGPPEHAATPQHNSHQTPLRFISDTATYPVALSKMKAQLLHVTTSVLQGCFNGTFEESYVRKHLVPAWLPAPSGPDWDIRGGPADCIQSALDFLVCDLHIREI